MLFGLVVMLWAGNCEIIKMDGAAGANVTGGEACAIQDHLIGVVWWDCEFLLAERRKARTIVIVATQSGVDVAFYYDRAFTPTPTLFWGWVSPEEANCATCW